MTDTTTAVDDLLASWKGSGGYNQTFVPAGWNGKAAVYSGAFKISCRSCHYMRENVAFDEFKGLSEGTALGQGLICDSLLMPNAQRTFTIFWGSQTAQKHKPKVALTDQPKALSTALGLGACPTPFKK